MLTDLEIVINLSQELPQFGSSDLGQDAALSKNTLFIIICALLPESICLILLLKCLILHVSLGSLMVSFATRRH